MDLDTRAKRIDRLCEQLHAHAQRIGSTHCSVLMCKPSSAPVDDALAAAFDESETTPVPIRLSPLPEAVWPWLLSLDLSTAHGAHTSALAMREAWRGIQARTLQTGEPRTVFAWVFHDCNQTRIASHLASISLQRQPEVAKRKWLRIHDPLVLDLYWSLLSRQQQESLLGPATMWAYVGRWEELRLLSAAPSPHKDRHQPTSSQWKLMRYVGAVNQAWTRAIKSGRVPSEEQLLESFRAMGVLENYALHEAADIDLFAWHCLRYGSAVHQHPEIRRILELVGEEQGYCYLASLLPARTWDCLEAA